MVAAPEVRVNLDVSVGPPWRSGRHRGQFGPAVLQRRWSAACFWGEQDPITDR